MIQNYTIKPLEWSKPETDNCWIAHPIRGYYYCIVDDSEGSWTVEDYDCNVFAEGEAGSLAAAKAACEAHYRSVVEKCLERVEQKGNAQ